MTALASSRINPADVTASRRYTTLTPDPFFSFRKTSTGAPASSICITASPTVSDGIFVCISAMMIGLEVCGLLVLRFVGRGEDIGGATEDFNRLGTVPVVVLETALVAAQLLLHLLGALVEGGVDLGRVTLGRRGETGRQMHSRLADELVRISREHDVRVGRSSGVLFEDGAEFALDVALERFADVYLTAADLIPQWHLPWVERVRDGTREAGRPPVPVAVWDVGVMRRGGVLQPGSGPVGAPLEGSVSARASPSFGRSRGPAVNGPQARSHPIRKCWPR
jgi:hypothetical protein